MNRDANKLTVNMPRMDRLASMRPSAIRQLHDHWQALKLEDPKRLWIPLHFGEPDRGTPPFIVEAGCEALRRGAVFYENNSGRPDLKAQLAQYYEQQHGVALEPDNFLITCGGTQAILLTMLALLTPGDEVVIVTPAWPNFAESARIAGATVHELALTFDARGSTFKLDFDALQSLVDQCRHPRLVVVNSPSNPTGWVISDQQQQELTSFCERHDLILLADEIYDRIVFTEQRPPSFLHHGQGLDRLLVINGFSKTYCMTGWRVGYLVLDATLAAKMARMQEFITSHAPSAAQVAGITALHDGEPFVQENLLRYRILRDGVVSRLQALPGTTVARPDGSIYIFFRLPGSKDSMGFCRRLLAETAVVLAPGQAFGAGGEGWLRLCFAMEERRLHEAIDRLSEFVASGSSDGGDIGA